MKSQEIRERYLKFFEKRGHTIIPSASLIPENDPSSLFTTAGMQPLVPYLLGQKHPAGTRLVDVQKCVRTGDIYDVGDNRHLTFFEMMGNWSLGDYFKKESIAWSLEFLTSREEGLGLDPQRIYVTTFKGEQGIPRDEESISFWQENYSKHGIKADTADADEMIHDNVRIIPLGVDDNFWIAGTTGPCGGDTEMFYDTVGGQLEGKFADLVKSGRIIEVWNNVFMEFNKTADGKYEPLAKKNVDTGMGLERTAVVMQGKANVFESDVFLPIISEIRKLSPNISERAERIISDHIRAAVFMISDGVTPANSDQGYVLRRLIRRSIRHARLGGTVREDREVDFVEGLLLKVADTIINLNQNIYPELNINRNLIISEIAKEEEKFIDILRKGLEIAKKLLNSKTPIEKTKFFYLMESPDRRESFVSLFGSNDFTSLKVKFDITEKEINEATISGAEAFNLFQSYGFPLEMIDEIATEFRLIVDHIGFRSELQKHQEVSKIGSEQKFKGGLAGTGEMETKYHTATHLLLASLRKVLGADIVQKGSNITAERLRFDFNWPEKLTAEQIKAVEDMVNQKIEEKIPVMMMELPKEEAKKVVTTLSFDLSKYGDIVKVYIIGDFSAEFCGGPHVSNTGTLGTFRIAKEEASSAGIRRIKAVLE